jgi:hypothetical protein
MLKYEHLEGRQFSWTEAHCYTLVRDFYRDNFQIELSDYACPHEWWNRGLDLYSQLYYREGFRSLDCHPRDYLPGDLIMMSYDSPVANHLGVLLDNGRMLHHMVGGLSKTDPYSGGGFWRSRTVGVLRHQSVAYKPVVQKVDMWRLLPENVRPPMDHPELDFTATGPPAG